MSSSNSNSKPQQVCIVGAGPAGLYLAHLLLQLDDKIQINVLEKAPQAGTADANAFGFGVGPRHQRYLEHIPGLWSRIQAHSAPATGGPKVRIIGRNVLCRELWDSLVEQHGTERCQVTYDTSCETVDFDNHSIVTSSGEKINYDLLVAGDGVNSKIRQLLVEQKGLHEEHYLRDAVWKSLKIPKQPAEVLDPGAFKPLSHPSMRGAIFPRFPEGHTALIFWTDMHLQNPKGIQNETDLVQALSQAVQPKANRGDWGRKLFFWRTADRKKTLDKEIQVQFDEKEALRCVHSRPRHEHYLKLNRYHDAAARVALVGDSAHGMYSFLGQGAACALQNALVLANSLQESADTATALQTYSDKAVPEGHAATDLNLMTHAVFGSLLAKLLSIPLLLLGALRGKLLMTRLIHDVSYEQLRKENSWLVRVSQYFWNKKRVPLTQRTTAYPQVAAA